MAHGIDNFLYTIEVNGSTATYKFSDPGDITNVAEGVLNQKELPDGQTFDSRESSDLAYAQVSDKLNEKRSARIAKEAAEKVAERQKADAAQRAAAADFHANAQETAVAPAGTEKRDDGTTQTVYNTGKPADRNDNDKKK